MIRLRENERIVQRGMLGAEALYTVPLDKLLEALLSALRLHLIVGDSHGEKYLRLEPYDYNE